MPVPRHADQNARSRFHKRTHAWKRAVAPAASALALALALAPVASAGTATAASAHTGPVAAAAKRAKRKAPRNKRHKVTKCRRGTVLKHGRCVRKHSSSY